MRERESIIAARNQAAGKVSGSDGAAALLGDEANYSLLENSGTRLTGKGIQLIQIRELLEEFFYRRWRFARTVWTINLRRQFANTMVEDKYLAILLKRLIREKIVLALESRPATQF